MDARAIALHDEALVMQPKGARHDRDVCPICLDWALTPEGVPAGFKNLDDAARGKPYGDVNYADPGLIDDVARFPLDSEPHIRAAADFITKGEIANKYETKELEQVKARINQALEGFGAKPQDSSERDADLVEEGGKANMDEKTLTEETHKALLAKAVQDATEKLSAEVSSLNESVASLTEERDDLASQVETLTGENSQLNSELDDSQVKLKAAEDEIAELKDDIAKREEEAQKSEVASERSEQVRKLGLFTDEYISEKASRWADLGDEDWAERLEEWKQARDSEESAGGSTEETTETAMKGSTEGEESTQSARRAVLGLVN